MVGLRTYALTRLSSSQRLCHDIAVIRKVQDVILYIFVFYKDGNRVLTVGNKWIGERQLGEFL